MRDIQNEFDIRNISIDKVGIRDIEYPIIVKDKSKGKQHSIARISMSVNLPHSFKGTHMSRFVEVLNAHKENISIDSVATILDDIACSLGSDESHIEFHFKYFMEKNAPVSRMSSLMGYDCVYEGSSVKGIKDFVYTVFVPVLSLCPCSKEISEYGAHNQRSIVKVSVRTKKLVWLEELIAYAEGAASSPIYALLKREDEKYITEYSYEHPVFVEDVVRNVTQLLDNDKRIIWFEVSSDNMESIHNHSAWALISRDKRI